MNLFKVLKNYLDTTFDRIKLQQPLFFNGSPGLRFELNSNTQETGTDNYFAEVVGNMDRIHAVTTSDNDLIILYYHKYAYKRRKIRAGNYLFKQINSSTAEINFRRNERTISNTYEENRSASDGSCAVIIKDRASNINFHNLYYAVAHSDFAVSPYLANADGDLFIVNINRKTITLMYDDRGCDIISPNITLLKSYYDKLSDLVLEINRPRIIERLQIKTDGSKP